MKDEESIRASIEYLVVSLPSRARLLSRLIQSSTRRRYFDLSPAATSILAAAADAPRRIADLADLEGLPQPYVTRIVGELVARGLVTKRPHSTDRRVSYVLITEEGRIMLNEALDALRDTLVTAMAGFSRVEIDALVAANEAIRMLVEALQRQLSR